MRRVVKVGIRAAIAVGVIVLVLVAAVVLTHRPDTDAYFEYVATYGYYDGKKVDPPASERDLKAAGQRACEWLQDRPMALWRTDPKWRVNSLYIQYGRSMPTADSRLPEAFLPGAYAYLCPLSKYVHEPHSIGPSDD